MRSNLKMFSASWDTRRPHLRSRPRVPLLSWPVLSRGWADGWAPVQLPLGRGVPWLHFQPLHRLFSGLRSPYIHSRCAWRPSRFLRFRVRRNALLLPAAL